MGMAGNSLENTCGSWWQPPSRYSNDNQFLICQKKYVKEQEILPTDPYLKTTKENFKRKKNITDRPTQTYNFGEQETPILF